MCGGGGSSVPAVDPMEEAKAQIYAEQEKRRMAEEAAAIAEQKAAQEKAVKQEEFKKALASAFQGAQNYSRQRVSEKGLNYDDYAPAINSELLRIQNAIPELDANPSSYFTDTTTDSVLNRVRDTGRTKYANDLRNFAGTGFENNLWASTADDALLDAELSKQYGSANDQLLRAFQRGNLNDTGYKSGQETLAQQKAAAASKLQDLGGGVLSKYKNDLKSIADTGYNSANSWELGQTFDPNTYKTNIDTRYGEQKNMLGGDIANAIGGTNLFDVDSVLSKAGIAQGATGAPTNAIAAAMEERAKKKNISRGIGSSGSF